MSTIGSGKPQGPSQQELIYQDIADRAADAAGPIDEETGEKTGKQASKGKLGTVPGKPGSHAVASGVTKPAVDKKEGAAQGEKSVAGAEAKTTGVSAGHESDKIEAGAAKTAKEGKGPAAADGSLPAGDKLNKTPVKTKELGDVKRLVAQDNIAKASQQVKDALAVLTKTPPAADDKYKKAITDFVDGMQAMGRVAQTPAALQKLFVGTSSTPEELEHKQALADEAGVEVATTSTLPQGVKAVAQDAAELSAVDKAQQQLTEHLAAGNSDEKTIQADVKAFRDAMVADGKEGEVGTQLASLIGGAGVSKDGMGSVLAAAAKLGIPMPGSMDDNTKDAQLEASAKAVDRANAKAVQDNAVKQAQEAQQAYAAQQKAAQSSGGGSSGGGGSVGGGNGSTGAGVPQMGNLGGLAARTGEVKGKVQLGILPDYDTGGSGGVAGFKSRTGVTPARSGGYVDISKDGTFDSAAADRWIKDAADNGVPTVSLSISIQGTAPPTADALGKLKAAIDSARSKGLQIEIRWGYEMNYGGGAGEQGSRINANNNTGPFKEGWAAAAAVVNPYRNMTPPALMVWSPNEPSGGTLPLNEWLPDDPTTIDKIGIDKYFTEGDPLTVESAAQVLDPVFELAKKINVPFYFGETGMKGGGRHDASTQKLLDLVTAPDMLAARYGKYYLGADLFNYNNKDGNVYGVDQAGATTAGFHDWYAARFGTATDAAAKA